MTNCSSFKDNEVCAKSEQHKGDHRAANGLTWPQDTVYAFSPRHGDWFLVAESRDGLEYLIDSDIGGDQCDNCGSFNNDGESVPYKLIRYGNGLTGNKSKYTLPIFKCKCEGCGTEYSVQLKEENEVIF